MAAQTKQQHSDSTLIGKKRNKKKEKNPEMKFKHCASVEGCSHDLQPPAVFLSATKQTYMF